MGLNSDSGGEWLVALALTVVVLLGLWLSDFIMPDLIDTAQLWLSSLFS